MNILKNKKVISAIVTAIITIVAAIMGSDNSEAQVGGGGVGGFPTQDFTLSGTLTAEQITSTDDLTVTDAISSTSLTATGTVQAEQLTSTDDLTVTDAISSASLTATGTVQAEQLTSTDDLTVTDAITYSGLLSNNSLTTNTSLAVYAQFRTSDFGSNGSQLLIQKSSTADLWNIASDTNTGSNDGLLRLQASTLTLGDSGTTITGNGGVDITPTSGSFSADVVGCTTTPSFTVYYHRMGGNITFSVDGPISCTSNSTAFYLDANGNTSVATSGAVLDGCHIHAVDSGSYSPAQVRIDSTGDVSFSHIDPSTGAADGWTSSGTKGIPRDVTCTLLDTSQL